MKLLMNIMSSVGRNNRKEKLQSSRNGRSHLYAELFVIIITYIIQRWMVLGREVGKWSERIMLKTETPKMILRVSVMEKKNYHWASWQAIRSLFFPFVKMDIPLGIEHLYTVTFLKIILCSFSSTCMVKEMGWKGSHTSVVLMFRRVLMHFFISTL